MKPEQQFELEQALEQPLQLTKRPVSPGLEERMFRLMPVLNEGFVRVVDYMGDDAAIVQAARVSYGRGTRSVNDDRGLIRYLCRARHSTPFEMCQLKLHVKLPIFVARQWIRHRMGTFNEESARYSILANEFYVPEENVLGEQSKTNRQGRGGRINHDDAVQILELIKAEARDAYRSYEDLLNDRGDGTPVDPMSPMLARELARMNLTLNFYTQWYWKVDLHNLLHFLSLRMDSHAQYEIRQYANLIGEEIVANWCPAAWEAFNDYRYQATSLSRMELGVLQDMVRLFVNGETPQIYPDSLENPLKSDPVGDLRAQMKHLFDRHGLTQRERADFVNTLKIKLPVGEK